MDRIEAAARRYCELMGKPIPDKPKRHLHVNDDDELHKAEIKVREALAIQQAIKETE